MLARLRRFWFRDSAQNSDSVEQLAAVPHKADEHVDQLRRREFISRSLLSQSRPSPQQRNAKAPRAVTNTDHEDNRPLPAGGRVHQSLLLTDYIGVTVFLFHAGSLRKAGVCHASRRAAEQGRPSNVRNQG
jgi:hypothetical protein